MWRGSNNLADTKNLAKVLPIEPIFINSVNIHINQAEGYSIANNLKSEGILWLTQKQSFANYWIRLK